MCVVDISALHTINNKRYLYSTFVFCLLGQMSNGPMKSLVRLSLLAFRNQNRHREVSVCMLVFSATCPNDVSILLLKVACHAIPPGM